MSWVIPIGFEVVREPEWDPESADLMAAYLAVQADKGPHGISMERATAKGAKFVASPIPTHDLAQKAISRAQKKYYKENPDASPEGDLWHVEEITG